MRTQSSEPASPFSLEGVVTKPFVRLTEFQFSSSRLSSVSFTPLARYILLATVISGDKRGISSFGRVPIYGSVSHAICSYNSRAPRSHLAEVSLFEERPGRALVNCSLVSKQWTWQALRLLWNTCTKSNEILHYLAHHSASKCECDSSGWFADAS